MSECVCMNKCVFSLGNLKSEMGNVCMFVLSSKSGDKLVYACVIFLYFVNSMDSKHGANLARSLAGECESESYCLIKN